MKNDCIYLILLKRKEYGKEGRNYMVDCITV